MKLPEIFLEIEKKHAERAALFDEADAKHGGVEPPEMRDQIIALGREVEELEKKAMDSKVMQDARQETKNRLHELRDPVNRPSFPNGDGKSADGNAKGSGRLLLPSPGQQFAEADEFKEWFNAIAVHGHVSDKKKFDSPAVSIKGLSVKSLITGGSDVSGGAMVFNQIDPLVMLGRRPLTIRDVITVGQTSSDTVEYPRVTAETNNAAPVAEATAASGGSGVKPESALALEKVTATVKPIAHWIPATTRALSDAGQLRTLIDAFLEAGLNEELEDQIVSGDGTGENFTGIANTSGMQAQAWDSNILTTLRRGRTKVRTVGRASPTAYLLHPNDWEDIDLLQDNEGRYFFGGPSVLGTPRLWGLPVVESEGVVEGLGYVGDFRQCVLWDREQASIQVSNSHSDFFIRNLVAILAELRAAFGILRPSAIVEADLIA